MANLRRMSSVCAAALVIGSIPATVTASVPFAAQASSATAVAASIVPVEPFRILDSRNGIGTGGSTTPVGAGETIEVQVAGVGTVPADAIGVVLNVTGTRITEPSYITAWPSGSERPTSSVLNLTPGIDAPNMVTAMLGDGRLALFNFAGSTHLLADVAGYSYRPAPPAVRLVLRDHRVRKAQMVPQVQWVRRDLQARQG